MRYRPYGIGVFLGILTISVLLSWGCSVQTGVRLMPQSHFDYPNSNVTPLGRVEASVSTTSIFVPTLMDGDTMEEVIQTALKQKGGDILIDYLMTIDVTMIPIPILTIYTTTYKVDGTAAKMEIAKRPLR